MYGNEQNGMFEFDKNKGLYRCPLSLVFAIVRDGIFHAIDPFCFIKPIPKKEITSKLGFLVKNIEEEVNHFGMLRYGNDELAADNIVEGDIIIFSKDSEYTYNIFGERLYKMQSSDVLAKVKGIEWIGEEDLSNRLS